MRSKGYVGMSSRAATVVSAEPLESRQMFAATAVLTNGALNITGTAANDTIYVTVAAGGKLNLLQVVGGGYQQTHSFILTSVKSIKASLGDGSDNFSVNTGIGAIPITLDGGNGNDILVAGNGNDTITGGIGNDSLSGGAGKDKLDAGDGDDTLAGGAGDDTLLGGNGKDILNGGSENDTLDGGLGADRIAGELGNDTVTYASRTTSVFVDITEKSGELADDGAAGEGDFVFVSTENIIGGSGNDVLTGTTLVASSIPTGFSKNNRITGGGGSDTINGLDGDDTLYGGSGNDTIKGGAGNDTLYAEAGLDKLYGEDGNDTLYARNTTADADVLDGGAGTDRAQKDSLDKLTSVETLLT